MTLTAQEIDKCADFERQYQQGQLAPLLELERSVCGCDYGATSWATREEAALIANALRLAPAVRLLEIGAGSGWPALYLARESGCDVVLADLPAPALDIALQRAEQDGIGARCVAVVADAAELPFAECSFDAINHSDVLCCLVQKRAVLAECRRVILPEGCMVFSVIYIRHGLSATEQSWALETAPEFADTEFGYPEMLGATGWHIRERHDLTDTFAANCARKMEIEERLRAELEPLSSAAEFDARQARMRRRIDVLDRGHMLRELFVVDPA